VKKCGRECDLEATFSLPKIKNYASIFLFFLKDNILVILSTVLQIKVSVSSGCVQRIVSDLIRDNLIWNSHHLRVGDVIMPKRMRVDMIADPSPDRPTVNNVVEHIPLLYGEDSVCRVKDNVLKILAQSHLGFLIKERYTLLAALPNSNKDRLVF
jgi:hypothetical protein